MSSLALGLMSGTSGDGVSLALAKFSGHSLKLLGYRTFLYPKALSQKIGQPSRLSLSDISTLNFELGNIFALSALKFLKGLNVSPCQVDVIGSHGQTLFHNPSPSGEPPSTFQIGESAVISEKTGVTVVSNFRESDVAAGGEGAPLIPFFDRFFFGRGPARSLLNIGGIANLTLVGKAVHPLAFDTGPGNGLMDLAVARATRGKMFYDRDGAFARRGKINFKLVRQMARHPYFSKLPPKSTGREVFKPEFFPRALLSMLSQKPYDAIATLTCFTAATIYEAHKRFVFPKASIKEVIVSGGGAFNRTLMRKLAILFDSVPVRSIQEFGIHPQAKEPLAFAFFAIRTIKGKNNHLPEGTGASGPRILGKITPGKNFRGIQ